MRGTLWCRYATFALALFATVTALPGTAETRALLVGVWKFQSPVIPDLKGPENDLSAMEALVRQEGATDVTVLQNDQVTRTTVETALHAIGLRSKPGDWILVYYSGHGAQADAAIKGTADGDLDQFLPLAGFDPEKQDVERFIVDKDFYAWMARYIPRNVQVLMVADACHSGTLNRSIDKRAYHFTPRLAFRGDTADFALVARPAPRFPGVLDGQETIAGGSLTRADLPNVIYIGAALDDQFALEAPLPVEGAPSRGLLTYSFEQGLTARGADGKALAADLNADGRITVDELAVYLNSQVRALTSQRQESAAHIPAGRATETLFATPAIVPPAPIVAPPASLPAVFAFDNAIGKQLAAAGLPWRAVGDRGQADFVWDSAKGVVLRRSGDAVAQNVTTISALRGVVEKWNAVEQLRPFLSEGKVAVAIGPKPNGARYPTGASVMIAIRHDKSPATAMQPRYLTLFDIAADGTVQTLYPLAHDGAGLLGNEAEMPLIENQVVAPFGADHVIAVVTPTDPTILRGMLRSTENQRAAERLVGPIKDALASARGQGSLSIGELYTGD